MIDLRRITDPSDADFQKLTGLYIYSFPEEERREISQLENMLVNEPLMHFNAVREDGVLAGLFVYWSFEGFHYLEHLAVFEEMRNSRIGGQVLDWVSRELKGERILEVEPAETEITCRRIAYYGRNGYSVWDKGYMQPSYRDGGAEYPLWIMGNGEVFQSEVLQRHLQTIREKVYYRL